MKRGLKSLLFGVHQFIVHPVTVILAWKHIYGKWPAWWELVAIAAHDVGYAFGAKTMDGPDGIDHPILGACITYTLVRGISNSESLALQAEDLVLGHSSNFARKQGIPVSRLYLPDKASILFDPEWFYMFRARLSGELQEYVTLEELRIGASLTPRSWFRRYHAKITVKANEERARLGVI